jgi:hypothetical protein
MVDCERFEGSLKEIPGGRFDANIEKLANWALADPGPIYLRRGYECDRAHNHYPPDEYVKAFRYIQNTHSSIAAATSVEKDDVCLYHLKHHLESFDTLPITRP